jgi:hypothetical protein
MYVTITYFQTGTGSRFRRHAVQFKPALVQRGKQLFFRHSDRNVFKMAAAARAAHVKRF